MEINNRLFKRIIFNLKTTNLFYLCKITSSSNWNNITLIISISGFLAVVSVTHAISATRRRKETMKCSWPPGWSVGIVARNNHLPWIKHVWPASSQWPKFAPSIGREAKDAETRSRWASELQYISNPTIIIPVHEITLFQ